MPRPGCKLTFDLLTLKVVSESRVMWATSVPILVFLGLSVLDLGPMYATDSTDGLKAVVEAEADQGRGRELEAEARQTKFEARPRRGDPLKNPPSPRCIALPNVVALSQTV